MEESKLIREKKALNRLFKLTVIGSVFIVLVYSVYYYSNAHKYTQSNIVNATKASDVRVNGPLDTVVGDVNLIFSDNQYFAKRNTINGWKNRQESLYDFSQNSRTTVALSGLMEDGFFDAFNTEMRKHFHNIPPIDLDQKSTGMVVKSIQFEHFVFPYHAMINWDQQQSIKTFSFYADSLDGEIKGLPNGGFSWTPANGESRLIIQPCAKGDSVIRVVQDAFESNVDIQLPSIVQMPIVDFDMLYTERGFSTGEFTKDGSSQSVVQSTGEVKLLVGPSLKQGNAYDIDATDKDLLEIKYPFMLSLQKKDEIRPYFLAIFANEKLLLK